MVVNLTTNISLNKPTESEIANNWVKATDLNEANNIRVIDKTDIQFATYTPVIIATTTNPNLGTATSTGRYQEFQGVIWGTFIVPFADTGILAGSGEYGISLPVPADGAYHSASGALNTGVGSFSCLGEGYIQDNSNIQNCGTVALELVTLAGVSYVRLVTEAFAAKTSRLVRDAMPFTVAHADSFSGSYVYKKA